MKKLSEKIVISCAPHYDGVARLLRKQYVRKTRLGTIYARLATSIDASKSDSSQFKSALHDLFREIAARVGRLDEVESHLAESRFRDDERDAWLMNFLVQQKDRSRYDKSLVDACKIAGEAFCAYYARPRIQWMSHYRYAAPPRDMQPHLS